MSLSKDDEKFPNKTKRGFDYNYYLPENVKTFLINLNRAIKDGKLFDIQALYDNTYRQLTDYHYDKSPWPKEEIVTEAINVDKVFIILYKQLFYRHIHARVPGGPSLHDRVSSFFNYCAFFNYIISATNPVSLILPDIWLWELMDEFIYQFQQYAIYRSRVNEKSPEEISHLSSGPSNIWSTLCVLNVLHSLIDLTNIREQLKAGSQSSELHTIAGEFGRLPLYKMLGYFSIIGLLRIHSILGDYHQAIKVLEPFNVHLKGQYLHIPACQISIAYYVGFAYMMMRRYSDAISSFTNVLLYVHRTKQLYSTRSYQNDQIIKQVDQMYHLLSMCLVLHPQCIDESIQLSLRDKNYHESMFKMQFGDLEVFRSFFMYACPKFVCPCPPTLDATSYDYAKESIEHQLMIFMDEVRQQYDLPSIRSYMKLYTTLPIDKLAILINSKATEKDKVNLLIRLLCFKHKMTNVVWSKGYSGLEGEMKSNSELDFYIDDNMIHIVDTKVFHRIGEFFIRKIAKFQELNKKLENLKL